MSDKVIEKSIHTRNSQTLNKRIETRNTLIIGLNRDSIDLYRRIQRYPALGYNVKGFLVLSKYALSKEGNYPILGTVDSLENVVKSNQIGEILISIRPNERSMIAAIVNACKKAGVSFKILTDIRDDYYGHIVKDVLKDVLGRRDLSLRRMVDLFGAVFLMIVLFPLYIIVSLAIKIESKGPVFYSQLRVGRNGKEFRIYKFRSMVQDAEKASGPVWAQKNDPRITKVGHFMRKTRIDELPQLINVLSGDMSFIGPRPERPFFVEAFKQQIPFYANRHQIKPGVTGWAQVKWGYDETIDDVREKLRHDLYYVNNRSILVDIKIILLTFTTVLLGKGQ